MIRALSRTLTTAAVALALNGCCGFLVSCPINMGNYTTVTQAALDGDLPTVQKAVDANRGLLKAREMDGKTLLIDAVSRDRLAVATYLLDKGANIDTPEDDGLTPLHWAARNGDMDMIRMLLARKPHMNPVDGPHHWTPYDYAVNFHRPETADILKQSGGKPGGP